MDKVELVFKHYAPIILLILLVAANYAAFNTPGRVGVFPLKYPGSTIIPYRQQVLILVEDLLSGSQTLIETNGLIHSLDYTSASCNSCIVYVTTRGLDIYVLLLSITALLIYYLALRIIGLNARFLAIILILLVAIYLALFGYIEYYSIPLTDYTLTTTTEPLKTSNGVIIVDAFLKPDTLIVINTSSPVIVAYASTQSVGKNITFQVKAVNVEEFSDYITTSKYNVLLLITLNNKSLPNFTYHKLSITYLRTDNLLIVYQPLIITLVAIVGVFLLGYKAREEKSKIVNYGIETSEPSSGGESKTQ